MAYPIPTFNYKRNLKKIFGLSHQLQRTFQKKINTSRNIREQNERYILIPAKEQRQARLIQLSTNHRFIIESISELTGLELEEIIAGVLDEDDYINQLNDFLQCSTNFVILFSLEKTFGYSVTSGRYTQHTRNQQVNRITCKSPKDSNIFQVKAAIYKISDEINCEDNLYETIGFINLQTTQQDTAITAFIEFITKILKPAIKNKKIWNFNSNLKKRIFFQKISQFQNCLLTAEKIIQNRIKFKICHNLYKGFLLVPHQIKETSLNRTRVKEVEKYFSMWLRIISVTLEKG